MLFCNYSRDLFIFYLTREHLEHLRTSFEMSALMCPICLTTRDTAQSFWPLNREGATFAHSVFTTAFSR